MENIYQYSKKKVSDLVTRPSGKTAPNKEGPRGPKAILNIVCIKWAFLAQTPVSHGAYKDH